MPEDTAFDPGTVVADGLAVLVGLSGDATLAKGGTLIYGDLKEALRPEIHADDHATIALPCVLMAGGIPALMTILDDRAILAWKEGRFRKVPRVEVARLDSRGGSTVAPGVGARHTVKVLTVMWDDVEPWVVAVPDNAETTRFLRTCLSAK
jgi:hypothetical protein